MIFGGAAIHLVKSHLEQQAHQPMQKTEDKPCGRTFSV